MFLGRSGGEVPPTLRGEWNPKHGPKWSQMLSKWSLNGPSDPQMLSKSSRHGVKIGPWSVLRLQPHLGIDLGGFGAPFWLHKGPQKSTKIILFNASMASLSSKRFFLTFCSGFSLISSIFLRPFLYWRFAWTEKADVQNHPIFTVDLKDFTVAMKSDNQPKIYEKLC